MSSRFRRALLGLALGIAAVAVWPASALAAESLSFPSISTLQAGSNPAITTAEKFAPAPKDTTQTVVTSLAPGLLANLNANPTCITGSPQLTPACQIGTGTVSVSPPVGDVSGKLFLVPPQGTDAAAIEFVPSPSSATLPSQYIGISLNPTTPGSVNLTTTFPNVSPSAQITGFSASLNPTLNGQPFTRLPSSCATATSTMTVTYYGSTPTGTAAGSFTPTGCSALPYAPNLTAAISSDTQGGATIVTSLTQAANESATKSIALNFPAGLTPNVAADIGCLAGTGCTVGTATATSPLVPSAALAHGTVTLAGPATAPTLTIAFPAPFAFTISGTISLTGNSVTFATVPDIPLTNLTLNISGPNGQKAFTTDCKPANITGTFTAQSGATHAVTAPITFTGCAGKPTASGSVRGLANGHPNLKFKIAAGKNAPRVSSVAIGLPRGLRFSRSAFVTHKTCTVNHGKKKCTTTTLIHGLAIAGGRAKSVVLRRGRLVIALRRPASRLSLSLSGPLLTESKALQRSVKQHKHHRLTFTLKITDAKRTVTTMFVRLRA